MAADHDAIEHRRAIVRRHNQKKQARTEADIVYPAEKRCAGCSETKRASAFSKHRISRDGLRPRCKVCIAREHAAKQDTLGRKRRVSASLMQRLGVEVSVPPVEDTPDGPIRRVPLSQGAFAVIDAADWSLVAGRNWHLTKAGYATTNGQVNGRGRLIYMHVLIYGDADAREVDHEDLDKLNNRRGNLRAATSSQNAANKLKRANTKLSRFKGVRPLPSGRWEARVGGDGRYRHLGVFDTEEAAAKAYDAAARVTFGPFAVLNFEA